MQYGEILKKSYNLTIKNKILWIIGMLVGGGGSCSSGGGGNYDFGNDSQDYSGLTKNNFILNLESWCREYWYILVLIGLLVLFLCLCMFILKIIGQGALWHGVETASKNEKVYFSKSFKFSLTKFWKVLGIGLLFAAIIFGILLIIIIPALLLFLIPILGWIAGGFLLLLGILAVIFIALVINIIGNYAYCYAVLKDLAIKDSIKSAWYLAKNNLGETIVIALILMGINLGFAIVLLMIFIPIILLFAALGFLIYSALGWAGVVLIVILGLLILMLISIFIRGIINTYCYSAWYYAWKELVDKK